MARLGRPNHKVLTDGFVEQIRLYVLDCAKERADEQLADAFLWNARRTLEAMLRAMLTPYPPRKFEDLSVGDLLKDAVQRTIVPYELSGTFERLEELTRLGARVQSHEKRDLSDTVVECGRHLADAVGWFYASSALKREVPDDVTAALGVFKSTDKPVSNREALEKKKQKLETDLRAALSGRDASLTALHQQIDDVAKSIAKEREAIDSSRGQVDTLVGELEQLVISTDGRRAPRLHLPQPGALLWSLLVVLALALASGAFFIGYYVGRDAEGTHEPTSATVVDDLVPDSGTPTEVATNEAALLPVETVAEEGEQGEGAEPETPERPTPAKLGGNCPDGMSEFLPAEIRIIQPFPRKSWPPGPKTLPTVKVGHFCMDTGPVLVEQYEHCVAAGQCRPRHGCSGHPRDFPVNCVTWADASTYCSWRKASLPRIVHWERSLLSAKIRLAPARGTWEWTADPFPAEVLQRGPSKTNDDGTVWGYMALQKLFRPQKVMRRMCSWHKARAEVSRGTLSFRCVIDLEN